LFCLVKDELQIGRKLLFGGDRSPLIPGETKLTHYSFEFYGFTFFGIILARYLICAGGVQLFLNKTAAVAVEAVPPNSTDITTSRLDRISMVALAKTGIAPMLGDIKLSVLSSVVFALSAATIASSYDAGITHLYADIDRYPLWYLGVSYVVTIVLQDAYFYFVHRLFHHRYLFRWWHQGHHRSHPPTPWTSFAFDPPEAIAHSLFLVGIVFVLPLHFTTLIAVLTTMTVWAVVNHLDLNRLPVDFPHHWCGRWFTGPAHHAVHHHHYGLHYGLYFTFWDRQLGTQSPKYTQEFADVTH
jgi:Delta7-sterol 5-desaturase